MDVYNLVVFFARKREECGCKMREVGVVNGGDKSVDKESLLMRKTPIAATVENDNRRL